MDPEFATRQFLAALEQVPGWQRMRLTDAAQAVQVSAYPSTTSSTSGGPPGSSTPSCRRGGNLPPTVDGEG